MKAFSRWRSGKGDEHRDPVSEASRSVSALNGQSGSQSRHDGRTAAKLGPVSSPPPPSSSTGQGRGKAYGLSRGRKKMNGSEEDDKQLQRKVSAPVLSSKQRQDLASPTSATTAASSPTAKAVAERESSSFYSPSRIRFDSLISRGESSSGTMARSTSNDKSSSSMQKEDSSSGRWGLKSSRSRSSNKVDVALPEDLRTLPTKRRNKEASTVKAARDEAPLFVVSNTANTGPTTLDSSLANGADASSTSLVGASSPSTSFRAAKNLRSMPSSPTPPQTIMNMQSSDFGSQPAAPKDATRTRRDSARRFLSSERDTQHQSTGAFDAQKTSSDRSLALLSPNMIDTGRISPLPSSPIPSSPNASRGQSFVPTKQPESYVDHMDISRRSSTMSLSKSGRGRLSGVFGKWNKSSPGLTDEISHPHKAATSSSPQHAPPSSNSRSQMLASELNELAVAFEEGLLGEEDYRLLRKGVFDKLMGEGAMEIPKESSMRVSQDAPIDPSILRADDAMSRAASTQSKRSGKWSYTPSLLRSRSQRTPNAGSSGPGLSSDQSVLSNRTESFKGGRSAVQAQLALQEQFSQARQANSLRATSSYNAIDSAASTSRQSFIGNGSIKARNSVLGSSGQSAVTGFSMGGLSISSGTGLLGRDYADKGSREITAEIAVVELEGRRILENFKTLEVQAIGRYNLTFEQIRRAVDGVEDEAQGATPSDVKEGFVMVASPNAGSLENGHSADSAMSNGAPKVKGKFGGMMGKRRNFSSADALTANGAASPSLRTKVLTSTQHPPSSFRRSTHGSKIVTVRHSSMVQTPSSREGMPSSSTDEASEQALHKELIEIHRRKAEVTKKYQDRLAFLRSAERSARIREGLR